MPPNTGNDLTFSDGHDLENDVTTTNLKINGRPKKWYEFETEVIWKNSIFMIGLHLICLYYTITFPYLEQKFLSVWAFIMLHLTGIGVTAGVHRLWTHRAYKAKTPLRIILAILYNSAGQNKIYSWVRDHRVHHKYTDTLADPHDTNRGFWFSHVGWLMLKKRPEVRQRGKGIDMSDILNDPVVQFFDRNFVVLNTLLTFVIPVLIPVYVFNQSLKWAFISQVFMRYPWVLNITWSVNSFAHMFGYHSYDKNILPAENLLVGWAAGGEGWHNYHHVFPWDYKAAEFRNFMLNVTTSWIDMFAQIGWAYDLRQATPDHIKKVIARTGDGSHHPYLS
ncbi:acyl-CoA Delta-9 desaturase-like [Microplitis mediator]|uniref:acyl-CoA Delta-9 desaturase-like n=1 Tax=Microplitis mediator TaxID=375433 RepID=UPI00255658C8|nr:acyl-CoA Delta-9 desaturase-like [Microplitis mediator]